MLTTKMDELALYTDLNAPPDADILPTLAEWQAFCRDRADMQKQITAYENIAVSALAMSDAYNDVLTEFGVKKAQQAITAKVAENATIAEAQNKMRIKMGHPLKAPEALSKTFYLQIFGEVGIEVTEKLVNSQDFFNQLFQKYEPAITDFSNAIEAINNLDFVKNRLIPHALNTSMAKEVSAQIISL